MPIQVGSNFKVGRRNPKEAYKSYYAVDSYGDVHFAIQREFVDENNHITALERHFLFISLRITASLNFYHVNKRVEMEQG